MLPKTLNWVLLDTQSSCDIFNNSDMLKNIHQEPGPGLKLHSNGNGLIETNMMGVVKGYGKVWYHPDSLANIMSFANVRKKFKVNISTGPDDAEPMISVLMTNGKPMSFKEISSGLYLYDASKDLVENKINNTLNKTSFDYSLVSTVCNNEKNFTNREIRAAKLALDLYNKIGRPSQKVFVHALENNIIRDSPVSPADAKRAFSIYGKDVASIKGKTKRAGPNHIENPKLISIPDHIFKWHRDVTLCIDIFYVNKIPFLHTIS